MLDYLYYFIWPIWKGFFIFLFTFPITIFFTHIFLRKKNISLFKKIWTYFIVFFFFLALWLVLFPFPDFNEWFCETRKNTQIWQFSPFQFLSDIEKFSIKHQVWLLKNKALFQVIFNIFLILPLWFLWAIIFYFSFVKVVLFWFFVSLFFEFIQWTWWLWFFPCPYRLFDVDDLMLNTFWAIIGFLFALVFKKKLLKLTLNKAFIIKNENFFVKRIFAYSIDFIVSIILFFSVFLFLSKFWINYSDWNEFLNIIINFIVLFLYFVVFVYFFNWQSIWKNLIWLKIVSLNWARANILQLFIRSIIPVFSFVIVSLIVFMIKYYNWINLDENMYFSFLFMSYIFIFIPLSIELSLDWRWIHEKMSKTKIVEFKK